VSIGTGLAFETILKDIPQTDDSRELPALPRQMRYYKSVSIDVSTLCRNLLSSIRPLDTVQPTSDTLDLLSNIIIQELDVLSEIIHTQYPKLQVHVFMSIRKHMPIPKSSITVRKGPKVLHTQKLYKALLVSIMTRIGSDINAKVYHGFPKLSSLHPGRRTLLFTHHAYNLLGNQKMADLLESHTGKVKLQHEFHTKFKKSNVDSSHIPFCLNTLLLFGDRTDIKPVPMSIRKKVSKVGIERHWLFNTSPKRVYSDLISALGEEITPFLVQQHI
jgi:hypothetical protein